MVTVSDILHLVSFSMNFHVFRVMTRLTVILWLTLVMLAQVTLSGHCIHNFFECNHRDQREGDGRRPVREVYSAASPLNLSVSLSAMVIVFERILNW